MNVRCNKLRAALRIPKSVAILGCVLVLNTVVCRAEADSPAALTGIAHVAIRVADLEKAREFYHKLGYEEAFAMEKGGTPTEAFFKVDDRQFIELYPKRQPDQIIGFMHVCFEANDLQELHHAYEDRGLAPTAVRKAGAGNLLFTMEGPEKQNIEYTQYMPGSRHTLDIGKHLGPNRIADGIAAVAIEMQDIPEAETFYQTKLSFTSARRPLAAGIPTFDLPGHSEEQIGFVSRSGDSHYELILESASLKEASARLKSLQIPATKQKGTLTIHDPDGNIIVLVPKVRLHEARP